MANKTEDKTQDTKENDTEVEPFLGDDFAVVDDVNVKEENESAQTSEKAGVKTKKEDQSKKKKTAAKADGVNSKQADSKEKDKEVKEIKEDAKPEFKEEKKDVATKAEPASDAQKSSPDTSEAKTKATNAGGKDETLIINTEEDLDVTENADAKKQTDEDADKKEEATEKDSDEKEEQNSPVVNGTSKRKSARGSTCMWVSNIARRIKATDLKRAFSKHGRVVTAKIVTNGKSYFGYVCMDSKKSVERCIKQLNNTKLGDKVITISSERPDVPKRAKPSETKKTSTGDSAKKDTPKTDKEKDAVTKKEGGDSSAKKTVETPARKRIEAPKKDETVGLKREIRMLRFENDKLRRRISEEQTHLRTQQLRAKRFERHYRDSEEKLKEERKKFDRERDHLLKKNRAELLKLDAERKALTKERVELRRRQDDLEREIRRFEDMQKSLAEKSRRRRSRSDSPRVISSKRFKPNDPKPDVNKKSSSARWSGDRGRTPPPPPKLSVSSSGKRDHERYYEDRGSRREVPVYVPGGDYQGRHARPMSPEPKSAVVVPSRSGWPSGVPSSSSWRSSDRGSDLPTQYSDRYRDDYRPSSSSTYPSSQGREELRVYSRVSEPEYRRPPHYDGPPRKY